AAFAAVAATAAIQIIGIVTTTKMMTNAAVAKLLNGLPADRSARAVRNRISRVAAMHNQIAADRSFDINRVVAAAELRDQVARDRGAAGDRHVVVPITAVI